MADIRRILSLLILPVLTACQGAQGPAWPWGQPEPPAEQALAATCQGDAALAARLAGAVNAARRSEGKTLLEAAPPLSQIAQSHACDMAGQGRADVEGSNGSSVLDRARAVGYPACGAVQLVWRGGSPSDVVAAWLSREAQRVELLGQASRQIGAGAAMGADGSTYYSVVMGDDCR